MIFFYQLFYYQIGQQCLKKRNDFQYILGWAKSTLTSPHLVQKTGHQEVEWDSN